MSLLDAMFASSPEDPRYGANMGLFASLMRGDLPGGLMAHAQLMTEGKQNAMRQKLWEAQLEETKAQAEERKANVAARQRKLGLLENWMGQLDGAVPQANQSVIGQTGNLSPTMANGALQQRAVNGLTANNPLHGVPRQALSADLALNDGKNIPDWLFKRGVPDMQVSGGYAYDKNNLPPGFIPQLNTSQNGQTSMVSIDPATGLPSVSAPPGAFNTYAGYRNLDEQTRANYDPITVTPQGQNPQMTTRGALVSRPEVSGRPVVTPPQQAALDRDRLPIMQAELGKAEQRVKAALTVGDAAGAERALGDVASIKREMGRLGGAPAANVGMPLQSDAEKTAQIEQVKADVQPTGQRKASIANANYMMSVIDQAIKHPGRETATGMSGSLDPRNYMPGTHAKGFQALLDQIRGGTFLQAYETLKGGGAITAIEGDKATNAIARLQTAQDDGEFLGALKELRTVISSGVERMKQGAQAAGVNPAFPGDNSNVTAGKAPARIGGDAEYNALPSGAEFIGPDGQRRRKP